MDRLAQFKENAKQGWATFTPTEMATATAAPSLVRFAGVRAGQEVLDVGCGTGVVALTAARLGAKVTGLDLTPQLIERARQNASIMTLDVAWHEGDAEALPFEDASFDVVLSQFGHMFAPRAEIATMEMLRVLKPGGTIAFSTWPPELFVGRLFALVGKYAPPPPPGASPPGLWGEPTVIRERLGSAVKDLAFDRAMMRFQTLSPQHQRRFFEQSVGPVAKVSDALAASDPQKLAIFQREVEELVTSYFEDNHLRQDFLLSRAVKI